MERKVNILSKQEILAGLNKALLAEYQSIADYGAHAEACPQPEIREALEALREVERDHALRLALRITALGGPATSQTVLPRRVGDSLVGWLAMDLAAEQWAITEYARLVAGIVDDDETAALMAELLRDEIRHAAWLKSTWRRLQQTS